MLNLFAIAEENKEELVNTCSAMVSQLSVDQANKVSTFKQWVESEALLSINMSLSTIAQLTRGQPYKNIYDLANEAGKDKHDFLRKHLKDPKKRLNFDKHIEHSQQFKYAALNAGCCGLTKYGSFCMVLSKEFQLSLKYCVCLTGDSLLICFNNEEQFDEALLRQNLAVFDHRHYFVAQHKMNYINAASAVDWPKLLLSSHDKRYFEVIFIADVDLSNSLCIRVSSQDLENFENDYVRLKYNKDELDDEENKFLVDFEQLLNTTRDQLEVKP